MQGCIRLLRKGAKRLQDGHPWAFQGEVVDQTPGILPGEIVRALDDQGRLVGQGFFNPNTVIAYRQIVSGPETLDRQFWRRRLELAARLRTGIDATENTALRLVHAEADGIPGLIVDRYGPVLVVQLLTMGIAREQAMWVSLLRELFEPEAILARNDQKTRELEGLPQEKETLHGTVPGELIVLENGHQFIVDVVNGQKTGAFLDQRENRRAARTYTHGRTLDAFCYQGWFAINCADRASTMLALDGSQPALDHVRRNANLNGLTNIETRHTNVFDFLSDAYKAGDKYDTILLDPPAFAKNRQSIEAGMKGYKEINLRAMSLLPEGGILVTSSCSYHLTEDRFLTVLESAARDVGRQVQLLEKRMQGIDHPVLLSHPESYYLKCFILRIL